MMKYVFMLFVAFAMALISSLLTAFGMADIFSASGKLILVMFVLIDLGRFLLFNFVVDEWNNLRKVKYFIVLILSLLFIYSGVGIFSKLDSLISIKTKEAMVNIASSYKAEDNANIKQNRSEDMAKLARSEYDEAMSWNKLDYENCLKRAGKNARAENNCNNTKRKLDKSASAALQEALSKANLALEGTEEIIKNTSQNQSEVASVLLTICKIGQFNCKTYDGLQLSVSLLIFLVIIGTDYLQIAIVLAVNTRKNKLKMSSKLDQIDTQKCDKIKRKIEPKITQNLSLNQEETSKISAVESIDELDKNKIEEIVYPIENTEDSSEKDLSKKVFSKEFYQF